jgi:hypothetical protein
MERDASRGSPSSWRLQTLTPGAHLPTEPEEVAPGASMQTPPGMLPGSEPPLPQASLVLAVRPSLLRANTSSTSLADRRGMSRPRLADSMFSPGRQPSMVEKRTMLMPSSRAALKSTQLSDSTSDAMPGSTSNLREVLQTIERRPTPRYEETLFMDPAFAGEERGQVFGNNVSVQYLSPEQRAEFKISVKDGKLVDAKGEVLDTRDITSESDQEAKRAIFVMDHDGNVYLSKFKARGFFQHSSFLAGQPVASAGYIEIEHGAIKAISRKSGHYKPELDNLDTVMSRLHEVGARVSEDFHIDERF